MKKNRSKLLLDEYPLQILPKLAAKIGLNEAILLQQIQYWIVDSKHEHDGKMWIYNSYSDWSKQFPFWSERTIKRIVSNLRKQELIETTSKYNKMSIDNTLWYTICYDNLPGISGTTTVTSCHCPEGDNLSPPITRDYTETTVVVEAAAIDEWKMAYEQIWGRLIESPYINEEIHEWSERITLDGWKYSLQQAADSNARNWRYLRSILKRVEEDGPPVVVVAEESSELTTVYIRNRETGELEEKKAA